MSLENPKCLVFFYVGLHFALRGGQEQRDLTVGQFHRFPADLVVYNKNVYYEYVEFISKNNQHRFRNIHSKNKVVKAYAVPGSKKCLVKIIDFYLAKLPNDAKAFYLRPLIKFDKDDTKPWYANVPVGVNTLQSLLSKMSDEVGASVRYTNHSLRATSASRLFLNNVPEKVIQEKTGHHNLVGLRAYERTTSDQEQNVTRILSGADIEETEKESGADIEETEKKSGDGSSSTLFSGQLNNCVFNFYSK